MLRFFIFTLVVTAVTACASRSTTTSGNDAPSPMATTMPAAQAGGHIQLTGAVDLSTDVNVRQCTVAKPGTSMMAGYVMVFRSADDKVGGTVSLHAYRKGGTFHIRPTGKLFSTDLIVNVKANANLPHGTSLLASQGHPTLVVTISDKGMKGSATFKDWYSIYGEKTGNAGGLVSGSITWTCDRVKPMPF